MRENIDTVPRDKFGRFSSSNDPNDFRKSPRKDRLDFKCYYCNKILKLLPWELKTSAGPRKFCSHKCFLMDRKKTIPKGSNSHAWRGGKTKNNGYIFVYKGKGKYELEHRKIMEKYLGRKLDKNELVHHKNGIKTDNRVKNLQIVLRKMHMGTVTCPYCRGVFGVK